MHTHHSLVRGRQRQTSFWKRPLTESQAPGEPTQIQRHIAHTHIVGEKAICHFQKSRSGKRKKIDRRSGCVEPWTQQLLINRPRRTITTRYCLTNTNTTIQITTTHTFRRHTLKVKQFINNLSRSQRRIKNTHLIIVDREILPEC